MWKRSGSASGRRSPAPRSSSATSGSSRTHPSTSSRPSGRSSSATGGSSMHSTADPLANTDWVAGLSPWPADGFGLGRIEALLARLGNPQRSFRAVHVVGTNGKSTATRTIAAMLAADGLAVGAYTSPHVSGWHERLATDPPGFERAIARVRPDAEAAGATQVETLT